MRILSTACIFAVLATAPTLANDTMSTLGAGGLVFVQTDDVKMLSEDLYVSPEQVRVKYEFRNEGTEDTDALVAFPMPDITGDGDFMVAIPTEDPENIFGFETLVNGEPVSAELHQYVFATNIDYTQNLTDLGLPLTPYGDATVKAINALDEATKRELLHRALVIPMEFDQGQGMQTEYWPVWTLRSTYSWEAHFPVGETVTVEHQYKPSVGGTVAVTFLSPPYEGYDPAVEYKRKYCTDDSFINTVKKTLPNPDEPYGAPFTEGWVSYIWSTGANWAGPVGKFHLTIDKVLPQNLVSFCWDGEVKKTGPTPFEVGAQDRWTPSNRGPAVTLLNRQ
ncbi:hypothetical protein VW23_027560, partial [Devosia insulae DS-56]